MHIRSPLLLSLLGAGLVAPAAAQDTVDFTAWLQQRYPEISRATAADAIAAARHQNLLGSPGRHLALKRALHALRAQKGLAGTGAPVLRDAPPGPPLSDLTDNAVPEVEFNDGVEFATDLGLAPCGRGDNSLPNDIDVYTFVSAGEYVTAEVAGQGSLPIADSMLGIKNLDGQMMAFSEDISGSNFLSRVSIYLPPGIYQAEVGPWNTTSGGGYDLLFQRDVAALTPLVPGANSGTTAPPGAGTQTVWTFTLAQDATVGLSVASQGSGADLYLAVQTGDGRLYFVNDDSSGGLDPAADLDLPAGTYTAHVSDLTGGSFGYSLSYTETPTTLADLGAALAQVGSVTGAETRRLYRLTVGAASDVDLQTSGGPTPIGDTILYLFDSDLDYLCDVDDANIANPNDYYSRMQIGLPPGSYFVGVRGWNQSAGDYTITPALNTPFPTTTAIGYGRNPVAVAGGGRVTLQTIDVCSANSVRLDSNGGFSGNARNLYNFMTDAGQSLGVIEWSQDGSRLGPGGRATARPTVGHLPRGRHFVLTWNRFENTTSTMTLDIAPPLHCEAGMLTSHGKAGDLALLFGDFSATPGVPVAGFGVDGHLCLPLASPTVTTLGVGTYPASGEIQWFACPSTFFGVYLQHGDLFATPGTFIGALRDRRQL